MFPPDYSLVHHQAAHLEQRFPWAHPPTTRPDVSSCRSRNVVDCAAEVIQRLRHPSAKTARIAADIRTYLCQGFSPTSPTSPTSDQDDPS